MVRCPQCDVSMNSVAVRANPGSLIELDQCAQCGGIWCDKWELFPIQPDEAGRLEPADQELLRAPLPLLRKTLHCPRCTARLSAVKEPSLGADVQFQRCLKCDAIWLNRGQFTRYKEHQKKVRGEKLGSQPPGKKLPYTDHDSKSWIVTGTKGMFAYPAGEEESSPTFPATISGAAKLVLQTLVRMVSGT